MQFASTVVARRMSRDAGASERAFERGERRDGRGIGTEASASRARSGGIFAACFASAAADEALDEGRAGWSAVSEDARTRGGRWSGRDASAGSLGASDGDEASSDGSNRGPDFGIDRATFRANLSNGVETNEALRLWLKRREMWVNPGRRRRSVDRSSSLDSPRRFDRRAKIPRNASYDSFLGESPGREFKSPIPLGEMVQFLNHCWDVGDGL